MKDPFVIGMDYGTDSVRAVVVNARNGGETANAVSHYRRWAEGRYCDPNANQFRQHPADFIESLETAVREALSKCPRDTAESVAGIAVDTTGSTPVAVDQSGTPLALLEEFRDNPNAMFILWKDHTAVREAEEINALAGTWPEGDFTRYEGGVYSSEWFWAKILNTLRKDKKVRQAAFSWVEHCDWIPALLTGITDPLTLKRSRCAAGHKAMWHPSWGGLPSEAFLSRLDPALQGLRQRLFRETFTSDAVFGGLSREWAGRLGLPEGIPVSVGAFYAHMGAVGGEIKPYILCKAMGTSTCDMLVAPTAEIGDKLIRGICGQVDGSIIPGMLGMEAGQSAFGDVYAWFKKLILWPIDNLLMQTSPFKDSEEIYRQISSAVIPALSREAAQIPLDESGIVALDWLNGRRTPYANQMLKGAVASMNLGSDAPRVFKALVESTAFGAKKIVDRFTEEGIPIKGAIAIGGIPKKAPYVMQVVADVLNMPIQIAKLEQATALGAAMFAAVAAGVYKDIPSAQKAMGNGFEKTYKPDASSHKKYMALYDRYSRFSAWVEKEFTP